MTDGTETITAMHFAVMALLAALVVIAIIAGVRRKRTRVRAQREVEQHAEEAGVLPEPAREPDDRTSPPATPPTPPPVAPAPPPVADAALPGTPDAPPAPRPLSDEPIAATIAPEGSPATIALDAEAPATDPAPADGPVTQLKGLGPRVAARLGEFGIDRVGQIAALSDAEAVALDAQLGAFAGRMARDRWVEQARLLAAGDRAGFERVFGRL